MEKKKIILTEKQIEMLAESEMARLKKEDIESMIGDPEDRKIEYPTPGEIEAIKTGQDMPSDDGDTIDPKDMKTPPHELLGYLDKIEEAKSILSKVAAKEDNENIKNRIYAHYEKAQKLAFELIKEFGIVH
jgi:hypothetical protein